MNKKSMKASAVIVGAMVTSAIGMQVSAAEPADNTAEQGKSSGNSVSGTEIFFRRYCSGECRTEQRTDGSGSAEL